jgi:uncharacterized membrane protein YebE (DUF533 family)
MQMPFAVSPEALEVHAITQEYGPTEALGFAGPLPPELRMQMGQAILAIAGADGISEKEFAFLLGRARQFGLNDEGLRAMQAVVPGAVDIAAVASQVPPSLRKVVLYDAILVARCDGFGDSERAAAQRWAAALQLDPGLVTEIEQHLEKEAAVRDARIRLLAP